MATGSRLQSSELNGPSLQGRAPSDYEEEDPELAAMVDHQTNRDQAIEAS
jgi:hypothetical protein